MTDAEKPLVLKGQLNSADIMLIKKQLSVQGLCIQPVVRDIEEAKEIMADLQSW